tara:strand:- start:86 stop:670 length:585 start_codon:yes stop_codon:yes gene_type:complete
MKNDKTTEAARRQINLAVRAMNCDGWRWVRGMVTLDGYVITRVDYKQDGDDLEPILNLIKVDVSHEPTSVAFFDKDESVNFIVDSRIVRDDGSTDLESCCLLPDLQHPATRGCLLQLVRDAWNDQQATPWFHKGDGEVPGAWSMSLKQWPEVGFIDEATTLVIALQWACEGLVVGQKSQDECNKPDAGPFHSQP